MSSNTETVPSADQSEDRFTLERARIGAWLVLIGIVVVFVGELVLHPFERIGITVIQIFNMAVMGACLLIARRPLRQRVTSALCFAGFSVTAVCTGAVGSIASDPTSTIVVLVGITLAISILIPWGIYYQMGAVAVALGSGIWALASIAPEVPDVWVQPIGSILPTACASVVVAHLLRQQRLALAEVERERRTREYGLCEANRILEIEIREREDTEKALRFAVLELDHRVKNTLATLQAVAEQTLETSSSPEAFAESFRGRIRAMARIHTALASRRWESIELRQLIDLVVGPYRAHGDSFALQCDDTSLGAAEARALGTALHELATNSAKYGALSSADGKLSITATVAHASEPRLHLDWIEEGGRQ